MFFLFHLVDQLKIDASASKLLDKWQDWDFDEDGKKRGWPALGGVHHVWVEAGVWQVWFANCACLLLHTQGRQTAGHRGFPLQVWKHKLIIWVKHFIHINHRCHRYARKKGFNCATKFRVIHFDSPAQTVRVETVKGDHNHELDVLEESKSGNLRWTAAQTRIIMAGVLNEASPRAIRQEIENKMPPGILPSMTQLANTFAHCRKQLSVSNKMRRTAKGEFGILVEQNSEPDSNPMFFPGKEPNMESSAIPWKDYHI